jgi:DNA-binding response OmpR family regulator
MSEQDSRQSRVGILEDEPGMRRLLERVLSPEFSVFFAESGADLSAAVRNGRIDVVLLDILLPGEDGIAIAKSVRARSQLPIVLLSGLSTAETIINGLNVGADDYVTKPFQSQILLARLRNALRRAATRPRANDPSRILEIDDCQVDIWARTASHKNGMTIKLTEKELQLLTALARNPGEPVARDTLSRLLSGTDWSPTNRCLDVHMSHLRKKLARVCENEDLIVCYRGVGYALKTALLVP